MTKKDFNRLLDLAVEKSGEMIDATNTYVVLTWWDGKFMPLITLDGNWRDKEDYLVFGDVPCNKWHSGLPSAFWINTGAVRADEVVHKPKTLSSVRNILNADRPTVKFLLCASPRNMWIDINPWKTRVIRNREGETFLCLYVDDRDSGEMVPFEKMTADRIQVIDETKGPGMYNYSEWVPYEKNPSVACSCPDCGGNAARETT